MKKYMVSYGGRIIDGPFEANSEEDAIEECKGSDNFSAEGEE